MARANLNINDQVVEQFIAAQELKTARFLKVKIHGEELVLDSTVDKVNSATDDFEALLPTVLPENEAAFVIFSANDDSVNNEWVLITWVPEHCRVRDKMLYSSSKEDLKRKLGSSSIRKEYAASKHDDLLWSAYQESLKTDFDPNVLTESERLIMEEKNTVAQENTGISKSSALNVIPFEMSSELLEAFTEYVNGDINWIEMTVQGEIMHLLNKRVVDVSSTTSFAEFVSATTACFIMTQLPGVEGRLVRVFIFSCPEETAVRLKMVMSSSKSAVLQKISTFSIPEFEKFLEIRSHDEIDGVLLPELKGTADNTLSASSDSAQITHAKPQRPGRGRAKVSKFTGDEN